MKKGEKLSDTLYFVEIKDLRNQPVMLGTSRSLREAVSAVSMFVEKMDTYSKVYREFTAMSGVFASVYYGLNPKRSRHLFVIIHSSKVEYSDDKERTSKMDMITSEQERRIQEADVPCLV